MRPMTRRSLLTLLFTLLITLPGLAQDASQVLRTSVGFRTVKNTAQMDEATRQQVTELEAKAQAANTARKYGDALKHLMHGMALMRKQPWTPAAAMSIALQVKAERLVFDPGETARLKLLQSFALDEPLPGKVTLTLSLAQPGEGKLQTVKELKTLPEVTADFTKETSLEVVLPAVNDGNYLLVLALTPSAGEPVSKVTAIRIERGLSAKAELLKKRIVAIKGDLEQRALQPEPAANHTGTAQNSLLFALPRAEYAASQIDLINSGALQLNRVDLAAEFANAHAMLDLISKGLNPLKEKRGDIHWAYHSAVDNTIQPYRMFIPANYDAKRKWPLVVALHGMGGDENSFFAGYARGVIRQEAEKRGYLIVCPKGRGSASMYVGSAERDVLDVLKEARREYNIDPDRIYLMGHSMGGYGTWSVAVNNPEVFAALAPISGGGTPPVYMGLKRIAHIPWLVTHGDKDPTVNVEESRKLVKAGQALGTEIKYNEIPGGDHGNIVVPAFKEIFDWFDAHKRQPKVMGKAAGSGQ
jgi:predicted esterase